MSDKGIRRWALLGALVSAALLTSACERQWPKTGGEYEGLVNEGQKNEAQYRDTVGGQQQGAQSPATGGSGSQQQQWQEGSAPNEANLPGQLQTTPLQRGLNDRQRIGAPGHAEPNELPQTDQGMDEPMPGKSELGGADKAGEKEWEPTPNQ